MKKFLLTALFASLFPFHISSAEKEDTSIGLILDCSASMWNRLEDGRYRIDGAKEVLVDFLTNTPSADGLHIGLRIYGSKVHFSKPGACSDSVLVVPIDGFDRKRLIDAVREARAIGATPLARSLELAASDFTKPGARRLIICTDGEESCGGDVRAALEALKAAGVDVDVRVIGIGLPDAAAKRFEEMGVPVENVHTAGNLAAALSKATSEVIIEKPAPATQQVTIRLIRDGQPLTDQTVEFSNSLTGGKITLTAKEGGVFEGQALPGSYTAAITPAERTFDALAVLPDAPAEFVLDLTTAPKVTLTVTPTTVIGGGTVTVKFEGAAGIPEEWLGFQSLAPAAGRPAFWVDGNGQASGEIEMQAPVTPGEYTVDFYTRFLGNETIAGSSETITVERPQVALEVPSEVPGNSPFEVKWTAPAIPQSWIGFCEKGAKDGDYINYSSNLVAGQAITFNSPGTPGDYEVRFHSPGSDAVLARAAFKVIESAMSLTAPDTAMAGSQVAVEWQAPKINDLYITMVMADAEEGTYLSYGHTDSADNPIILTAPRSAGQAEIRIYSNLDAKTVLRRPITLTPAAATLDAPESVKAGQAFEVSWTGPAGSGDYVTIITPQAAEGEYDSYFGAVDPAQPGTINAPEKTGDYEIRYVTGEAKTLTRRPIKVVE